MKKLFTIIFIASISLFSEDLFCQREWDTIYGKPLIILNKTHPRLPVVGADVPMFALYEKGQIIYETKDYYKEVKLSKLELDDVIKSFNISNDIYNLEREISVNSITEGPAYEIILYFGVFKYVSIYGNLEDDSSHRNKAPICFINLFDKILHYRNDSAYNYIAKELEVYLWDFSDARRVKKWAKTLPDLYSPTTVKDGENSYRLYITNSKDNIDNLKKFYDTYYLVNYTKRFHAVLINKKKMSIFYRQPFPNVRQISYSLPKVRQGTY